MRAQSGQQPLPPPRPIARGAPFGRQRLQVPLQLGFDVVWFGHSVPSCARIQASTSRRPRTSRDCAAATDTPVS